MKVFVYYNLHRGLWSIKALDGPDRGRVIAHAHTVTLSDARARVSEAGRQRVLRERRKNVHAGIVGTLVSTWRQEWSNRTAGRITYNPYKGPTFVYAEQPDVTYAGSEWAYLEDGKVYTL